MGYIGVKPAGISSASQVETDVLDVDNIRIDGNTISSSDTNGDITLDPDGTGDVIVASGNLGVGTTSPGGLAEFYKAGTSEVLIGTDNGGTAQLSLYENDDGTKEGLLKYDGFNNRIHLATSGAPNALVIPRDSGNVGIGTSSPSNLLTLQSSGSTKLNIRHTASGNDYGYIFRTTGATTNDLIVESEVNGTGTERMRIDSSGRVGLGGTGLALSPSATITMESSDPPLKMYRTVTNAAFTCIELRSDSGSTNRHVFSVLADGDVLNVNNSYGSLSDASLKENVSAAASQWDDIKAVQVKKYSMIADNLDAANRLGVIAQDLEASGMDGLVKEMEDGTKTVKYSVLYMKAVKALQEAMTKIETLENEMTALKARVTALETP